LGGRKKRGYLFQFQRNAFSTLKSQQEFQVKGLCVQIIGVGATFILAKRSRSNVHLFWNWANALSRHESSENTQRLSELGGWEKMIDFILWTSEEFAFTGFQEKLPMQADQELDYWTHHGSQIRKKQPIESSTNHSEIHAENETLVLLFEVIEAFCTPLDEKEMPNGINKIMISILLDLFNEEIRQSPDNIRARNKLR
jgi:hypothetical protein